MASDKISLIKVNWDQNVKALREFRSILQSSMGPKGSCKIVTTGGGYLQLTSSSASLLARLELEHPVCRYIGHVSIGLPDFGLYFGVLVSQLVEQLWAQNILSKQKLSNVLQSLVKTFQGMLNSNLVCRRVDFSSIDSLLPLVQTVISSKCSPICAGLDVKRFCVEIVKVFLRSIDDQTGSVGRIYVKVETGPNYLSSHDGLLYELDESQDLKNVNSLFCEVRVIVFTTKLGHEEHGDSVLATNNVMTILECAIQSNIKIVACQKTVSNEIKLFLLRKRIVLLERMGSEFTQEVLKSSQAFPICDLSVNLSDLQKLLGRFSSAKHIQFNEKDFILLKSNHNLVGTLLVQTSSLAGTDDVKALAKQAINSLRSLAVQPALTLGGGCLEIWLIAQLCLLKQENQADKGLCTVTHWIQQALLSACGPQPPDMTDSLYHHGWTADGTKCQCGLVSRLVLEREGGTLIPVCELLSSVRLQPPRQTSEVGCDVLVDLHHHKLNVLISALETFTNLSDIGYIVYKD